MPTAPDSETFTFEAGYVPDQALIGQGLKGTIFAGEQVLLENGRLRVAAPPLDVNETTPLATYGFTATLVAGSDVATLSAGATARTDIRSGQHVLIGTDLYLVKRTPTDLTLRISPKPTASAAGLAVKFIPTISALDLDRGTLYGGNAVKFRQEALFGVGVGPLRVNGTALSAAFSASNKLRVAYPDYGTPGTYIVHDAGFTEPTGFTVAQGGVGVKDMPAADYPIRLSKKRAGFSGYGNPSDQKVATTTANGKKIAISLPAFDASEGQTAWFVWVPKIFTLGQPDKVFGLHSEVLVDSTTIEIEWFDVEIVELMSFDNDPPPVAQFVFTMSDYLMLAGCDGQPDGSGQATTPGPGVAASKLNNPEAFSPAFRATMSSGELINGVHVGAQANSVEQETVKAFLTSENTLQVLLVNKNTAAANPIDIRPSWQYGFEHYASAVMAEGDFYGHTGGTLARAVGSSDQREVRFSTRVRSILKLFKPGRTFVGWDPYGKYVVVIHSQHGQQSGKWYSIGLSYQVEDDAWSPTVRLGDTSADFIVCGRATVGGRLYLVTTDGKTWRWDDGTVSQSGWVATPFFDFGSTDLQKTARRVITNGSANGQVRLYRDRDETGLKAGAAAPSKALSGSRTLWKSNVRGKNHAVRVDFTDQAPKTNVLDAVTVAVEERGGLSN